MLDKIAMTHPAGVTDVVGDYSNTWDKNKTSESITGVMNPYGFNSSSSPAAYDAEDQLTGWNRTDGLNIMGSAEAAKLRPTVGWPPRPSKWWTVGALLTVSALLLRSKRRHCGRQRLPSLGGGRLNGRRGLAKNPFSPKNFSRPKNARDWRGTLWPGSPCRFPAHCGPAVPAGSQHIVVRQSLPVSTPPVRRYWRSPVWWFRRPVG